MAYINRIRKFAVCQTNRWRSLVLGLALVSNISHSATPDSRPDFSQIVRIGLEGSLSVRSAKLALTQTELDKTEAWMALLPTFSLTATDTQSQSQVLNDSEVSDSHDRSRAGAITASWNLWDNYSNIRNIKTQTLVLDSKKIETQALIRNYIIELVDAYLAYQLILNKREFLTTYLEQAKWTLDQSNLMIKIGARTQIDAMDSEVDWLNAQRDMMEFESQIFESRKRLESLLSCEKCPNLDRIDLLEAKPYYLDRFEKVMSLSEKSNVDELVRKNPTIRQSEIENEILHESYKQTWLSYFPTTRLELSHGYDFSRYMTDTEPDKKGLNSSSITLSLQWKLWDWFSTDRTVRKSEISTQISNQSLKDKVFKTRAEMTSSLDQIQVNKKSLEISKLVLEKAKKQMDFSKELYKLGRVNLLVMQQSTSRYYNARVTYAERLKDRFVIMAKILAQQEHSLEP